MSWSNPRFLKHCRRALFQGWVFCAGLAATCSLHASTTTPVNGDLFLGFRTTGAIGTDISYLMDLGQMGRFRDATTILDLGNINNDLTLIYGSGWFNNTGLLWGAVAVAVSTPVSYNGVNDPTSTIYATKAVASVGDTNVTAWPAKSTGALADPIGKISTMRRDYGVSVSSYNGTSLEAQSVAQPNSGAVTSWNTYVSVSPDFNLFQTPGIESSVGSGLGVLSLFRMVPSSVGSNVGYFSITAAGAISFTPYSLTTGGGGGGGPWLWTGGSGNWSMASNWTNSQVASNGDAVSITGAAGGMITNDAVTNIPSLTFSNTAGSYTLTGTNASQTLTVTGGITNNSAATQTIDLSIAGAGGVTQSGSGTMVLAKSNSYTGGTVMNSGALVIGNDSALGSGAVTVTGASSLIAGAANLSTTNAMAFNAATTIDSAANRWTNAGTLTGSGSLTKIGSGTLTIAGTGTSFSGNTALSAGSLQVASGSSFGSGTVTVASGAKLSGSGSVGGVHLESGGILTGGVDGAVGKLTVSGGMAFSANGILNWKLADANGAAGTGFDSFDVRGTLDLTGLTTGSTLQFNILNANGGTANFFNSQNSQWLVASAGSITGFSTNDFTISTSGFTNALGGGAFGFITNATGLYLKFTALGVDPWTGNLAAGSNVISGETITSTNSAVIGANSSRNGSVAVTNGGVWNVQGNLQVGGSTNGSGTLTIGSGGRITANGLNISDQKGSRGLILITNGAASNAISLGSGTVSFGAGNGTIQFAQSNAVTLSNAISGKGTISSTGTGTTTLSGNQAAFTGTNSLSSGKVVLGAGVTNGGTINIAGRGTNVVFAMNTNSVLSSTGTHAVAGLLLDNSGMAFKDSIKGSVVLSSTGVLQKTYTNGQSVAGFGAGIGAGKSFSILAGTAAPNGINTPTLQAKIVNGQLDFHGTTTNPIVMSMKDPSYSSIRNQIQWYDPVSKTWKSTVAGNTGNVTNAGITGMNGVSFAGSFDRFLLTANVPVNLGLTDENSNGSLLDDLNGLSGSLINSTLAKIMGAFGYDNATKTSWAVINHNSIFGDGSATFTSADLLNEPIAADLSVFNPAPADLQAVPEPGTWALMILGGGALLLGVRAKSRGRV